MVGVCWATCFEILPRMCRQYLLVDPSLAEEVVMEGRMVVGMNIHREICVLSMAGGVAILPDQVKWACPESQCHVTCEVGCAVMWQI